MSLIWVKSCQCHGLCSYLFVLFTIYNAVKNFNVQLRYISLRRLCLKGIEKFYAICFVETFYQMFHARSCYQLVLQNADI